MFGKRISCGAVVAFSTCSHIPPRVDTSFHFVIIDGLRRWLLRQPAVSTQQGPPAFKLRPRMERKFSLQNTAVLPAQGPLLENVAEAPCVFFQCPLAARLNRSSERRRKPKYRPLFHQAYSNPLSWLFAVVGRSPAHSHPLPGC